MPTLVFAKDFLDDFARLEPPVRQKVRELPGKFEDAAHAGVHLEKLAGARDERVRTVRVDKFWRGVVVRLGGGRFALLRVLPHDDANSWAIRQRFGVNPATGLIEILDVPAVEERIEALTAAPRSEEAGLFEGRRDRDFAAVGIDEEIVPLLRRLGDEAELLAIANLLPPAQADAVLLLADGRDPQDIWAELAQDYDLDDRDVDTDDIEAALDQPGTRSAFIVTTNDAELVDLLSGDFEAWRTFLHPSQRSMAYRPVYNGPARVTGGAGTGKTVVAIHRARYLARRLLESGDTTSKILIATYTTSLAANLTDALRGFCSPEEFRRLDISTVDSVAAQTLAAAGASVRPMGTDRLREAASDASTMAALDEQGLDGRFLLTEWEGVVLARGITSLPEYASTPRPGRGLRLERARRRSVWKAIEYLTADLARQGTATYLQIADRASGVLVGRTKPPYSHVIVDEAQDLHPAQWRLLRASVGSGPNDLFIAGDAHQRIYDHRVSLSSLGIETRGRSRRLKINYRTSQQILSWALEILTGEEFDDLDGELEPQTGYRSALDGPSPTIQQFTTPAEEADFVVEQIREWMSEGVAPSAIGIAARTKVDLDPVERGLAAAGIETTEVGSAPRARAIRLGSMHSFKGLEVARLALIAVNSDRLPLPIATTPQADDERQHALDVQRERCLLYVACTRARDELMVTSSGTPSSLLPPSPA